MKIVVVGGGGFVGHHLVKRLNDLNHEILVLDCGVEGYNKNNVINSPNVLNIIDNNYDTLTHLLDFNPDLLINLD
jgi:nucleoside-diphosphate-sugar epimerase